MTSTLKTKKIGVLLGGDSHERKVSLVSGNAIYRALVEEGFNAVKIDVKDNPQKRLKNIHIDIAFIALHGRGGEDGKIQRVLEKKGIAYTGSDAVSSGNAFDKSKTIRILQKNTIPVPRSCVLTPKNWRVKIQSFECPVFIKPIDDGSSIGVYCIKKKSALIKRLQSLFTSRGKYMIEECIVGREITIGILGGKALPIIELKPQNAFYDFNAKYTKGKTKYCIPASFPKKEYKRYQQLALRTHRALGMRDFSRVDMMIDANGNPFVLELNSIPGFTTLSLLPKAAKKSGLDFGPLCCTILQYAMKRGENGKTSSKKKK